MILGRRISKRETLGPAGGQRGAGVGSHAPLLAIFKGVDDEKADDLPHLVGHMGVIQIRLAHGEPECLFHRNGESETYLLVWHGNNGKRNAARGAPASAEKSLDSR